MIFKILILLQTQVYHNSILLAISERNFMMIAKERDTLRCCNKRMVTNLCYVCAQGTWFSTSIPFKIAVSLDIFVGLLMWRTTCFCAITTGKWVKREGGGLWGNLYLELFVRMLVLVPECAELNAHQLNNVILKNSLDMHAQFSFNFSHFILQT